MKLVNEKRDSILQKMDIRTSTQDGVIETLISQQASYQKLILTQNEKISRLENIIDKKFEHICSQMDSL